MSASPLRAVSAHADVPHAPGVILETETPAVGVLIEHDQRRLIALEPIRAGTEIFRIEGRVTGTPTRYSIQVGLGQHLDPDDAPTAMDRVRTRYWMYLNHHCAPSAWVRDRMVVALRDIAPGDGVTFDYNTTEREMASPFDCHCLSASCVGLVRGAKHLTESQRARIASCVATYLR